jgi:RsiW-degrading membrane proteinase PrsW (M82 family)
MKFLPLLFYLLVYEPKKRLLSDAALFVAIGFATFENVCYLTQNGAAKILQLLIRGFGTGAMHVVCGVIVAFGLVYLWDRIWIRIAGTIGLLAVAMTYHGIYNILVSQSGAPALIGYLIPMLTIILFLVLRKEPV